MTSTKPTSVVLPPRPCLDSYNTPSYEMSNLIKQVRLEILKDYAENPSKYDQVDIDEIRNVDWQVERFIRRKHTYEESVSMIKETLKWRNEYKMPQLKSEDFPEEFFRIGAMFGYEKDRSGNGMAYMRVRRHKKLKEFELAQKLFILYTINKVDKEVDGKGMAIVFDCKGCGLINLDMDILWFLLESLVKYFPAGISYILVYDLPWVLNSVWNMIRAWLPTEYKDMIKFANKEDIFNYVDKENVPRYMGGDCKRNMCLPPKDCLPYTDPKFQDDFSNKEMKQIKKHFQPYMDEAEEEERKLYGDSVIV